MADVKSISAPFHASAKANPASIWDQVKAMIQALIAAGVGKDLIEQEVDSLITASTLPAMLKPMLVMIANAFIEGLLAQAGK